MRALLVAFASLAAVGCQARGLTVRPRYDSSATEAAARAVVVRAREGGCDGAVLQTGTSAADMARGGGRLGGGRYGFEVEARDADCRVIARGCEAYDLPRDGDVIEVGLTTVSGGVPECDAAECADGLCVDEGRVGVDAGDDAGLDDAGPPVDAGPCPDGEECEGGVCVGGSCCTGCVEGTSCRDGLEGTACGLGGAACVACDADAMCGAGACRPTSQLAVASTHALARLGTRVWASGDDTFSQLGPTRRDPSDDFVDLELGVDVAMVATTSVSGCALDVAGRISCWGRNANGLLGSGEGVVTRAEAMPIDGGARWVAIDGGELHVCAIRADARLFCWGANTDGQLGSTGGAAFTPREVAGGLRFARVSAGLQHTCAITTGGALYCWGDGERGRLGLGDEADHDTPQRVGDASGWSAVSAGNDHSCGVRGGQLLCWGSRETGQVGDGETSTIPVTSPTVVDAEAPWTAVAAGQFHSCATRGRDLFCWGTSAFGETGLGMAMETNAPTRVGDLQVDAIASGWRYSCASDAASDPALYCWGSAQGGALGTGDGVTTHYTPAPAALDPSP